MTSRALAGVGALLALAAAPALLSAYELSLLGRFLAYGILAMGISLIWGTSGFLSLGQGLFFGIGGYALAMHLKLATLPAGEIPDFMVWNGLTKLPWWWVPFHSPVFAIAMVLIAPALLAAIVAYLVFRRRIGGAYFAIITQALTLAAATLVISQQGFTGGFNGLTNFGEVFGIALGDAHTQLGLYWVTLAILAAAFVAMTWLRGTNFGKLLLALRDGENRVRFLGYDPLPFKVAAFAIAAFLAGIAGALVALHIGVISPAMFGVVPSIEMVIWVAIGGRGSLIGAILGTLVVNFAKDSISSLFPDAWLYFMGLLFIVVVTVAPQGIVGLLRGGTGVRMIRFLRRMPAASSTSD
jgi:urea transport system permease protein